MNNSSCIFWFSGTGNSLYAAKTLSDALKMPLARITGEAPPRAVGGRGKKVGFVFPSYYGNLPRAVRAFAQKLQIRPDTYIFAIVTMGGAGQGSLGALKKVLKAKGLRLNFGRGVHMPPNYVLAYNPADAQKSAKTLDKADERLRGFAVGIAEGVQAVRTLPLTAKSLYKNIEKLDAGFAAGGGCTGCGLCQKICPVKNIRLENGRPKWLGQCERCVACISWCPSKAIDYGSKTQERRRYRNPRVKAEDLASRGQDE